MNSVSQYIGLHDVTGELVHSVNGENHFHQTTAQNGANWSSCIDAALCSR